MKLKTLYKSESSMPNILLLYSTDFADTRSSPVLDTWFGQSCC